MEQSELLLYIMRRWPAGLRGLRVMDRRMGGSNRGEPEGGHADRREKAIVIMCEEDVLGYGGMEAAETKEMADSMAGLLRAWRRRSNQVLVSVLVLLRPLDLSVLCVCFLYLRLCGSTAWICIVACRCSRGIDL